jgi:hypothetical protein
MLQAGRSRVRIPMRSLQIFSFNLPIPFSRTKALGLTQPQTEMSIRDLPAGVKLAGAYGWPHLHLWADCLEECGIFDVSRLYRPLWSVTGIASLYLLHMEVEMEPQITPCRFITRLTFWRFISAECRPQWPRYLKHEISPAEMLGASDGTPWKLH